MLSTESIQSYINQAIATASNAAAFDGACNVTPGFAQELCRYLTAQQLENTLKENAGSPFAEVQVNLIEEKWQDEFWWGQAYLSIKISKLGPVCSCKKVMVQIDPGVEGSLYNSWQHIAASGEAVAMEAINKVAVTSGVHLLQSELHREVDTGPVPLNAHYRKWKPTVYAVFFEKISE
jgi:hypothetical protein